MTWADSEYARQWDRDAVYALTDEGELQTIYRRTTEIASDIMVQIDAFNDAARRQDDPWFIRACGALQANRMVSSWCRRRMLELGFEPKRPASDPLKMRENRFRGLLISSKRVIAALQPGHAILAELELALGDSGQ